MRAAALSLLCWAYRTRKSENLATILWYFLLSIHWFWCVCVCVCVCVEEEEGGNEGGVPDEVSPNSEPLVLSHPYLQEVKERLQTSIQSITLQKVNATTQLGMRLKGTRTGNETGRSEVWE